MITEIHEHKVSLDLLPKCAKILDLGCRNFLFTNYFREIGHDVIALDIDDLEGGPYERIAITGKTGFVGVQKFSDPQATRTMPGDEVPAFTLEDFCAHAQTPMWDLIKIDVEGAEKEIIESLTRPLAKQLSIEFHLHTGIYSRFDVDNMVAKLYRLGYTAASHELTNQHGAGMNYWSSLFVLI